jgi:GR25 family glycosyltransferase involved in LPS biosynthesis
MNIWFFLIVLLLIIIVYLIYNFSLLHKKGFSMDDGLKIYFINLKQNMDRWENSKLKLPNLHRFNAINGKLLDLNKLRKIGILQESDFWLNKLGRGGIGCAFSHISIMHRIRTQKEKYGLILEDDVIIPENFEYTISKLEPYFPPNWDIIYLGGCNISGKKYNEKFIIPEQKTSTNYCCHAILFNKETIDNVIHILTPLKKPIDLQLRSNFHKLRVYFLIPSLFFQNKNLFSNRLFIDGYEQETNKPPNLVEKINIIE